MMAIVFMMAFSNIILHDSMYFYFIIFEKVLKEDREILFFSQFAGSYRI